MFSKFILIASLRHPRQLSMPVVLQCSRRGMLDNPVFEANERMQPRSSSCDDSGYVNEEAAERKEKIRMGKAAAGDEGAAADGNKSGAYYGNPQQESTSGQQEESRTYRRYANYDDGGGPTTNQTYQSRENRKIHERWFTLLKPHNLTESARKKFRMVTQVEDEEREVVARRLRMQEYQRVLEVRQVKNLPADARVQRDTADGESSDVRVSIRPRTASEDVEAGFEKRIVREGREEAFWTDRARRRDEQHTLDLAEERKLYEASIREMEMRNQRDAEHKGETNEQRAERLAEEEKEARRESSKHKAVDLLVKAERRVRFSIDYGSLFFMQHLAQAEIMIEEAEEILKKYDLMTPQLLDDIETLKADRYDMIFKLDLEGQQVEMD